MKISHDRLLLLTIYLGPRYTDFARPVSLQLNFCVRISCPLRLHLGKRRPTKKSLVGLIRDGLRVHPAFTIGWVSGILISIANRFQKLILNRGHRSLLFRSQFLGIHYEHQWGIHRLGFTVSG